MQPGAVDLSQIVNLSSFLGVAGLGVLIGILMQAAKPLMKPGFAAFIPLTSIGVGVVLALVIGFALDLTGTKNGVVSLAILGLTSGSTASGIYEATLDKLFPGQQLSPKATSLVFNSPLATTVTVKPPTDTPTPQ